MGTYPRCSRCSVEVYRKYSGVPMRVLVVEDQALTALAVSLELERAGYQTCGPAYTASEALALARTYRPNIALVDISLEEPFAGIELADRLHSELGTDVIFITSQVELARAHSDSAFGVIAKPFALGDVPDSVAALEGLRHHGPDDTEVKIPHGFELFEHEDEAGARARTGQSREFA
jgi:CheY-like chemotaxis protein